MPFEETIVILGLILGILLPIAVIIYYILKIINWYGTAFPALDIDLKPPIKQIINPYKVEIIIKNIGEEIAHSIDVDINPNWSEAKSGYVLPFYIPSIPPKQTFNEFKSMNPPEYSSEYQITIIATFYRKLLYWKIGNSFKKEKTFPVKINWPDIAVQKV